ncbi:metal ABC transporter substrate-binding protein [Streptomyces globosus]|uniref:Anti-sigma factor antagonist n=1 Tax=Streptomyces globosus TaxID=68209 RepID=A0A344U268_9ACTN|nr:MULTISPECIES: STAS domain-containing protein [Streptomyces]AXE24989.1 metal ABC transporter substrate-binding protein [Streptomyces globosus]
MVTPPAGSREGARGDGGALAVEVRPDTGTVVLLLAGELDHDTAEPLRDALQAALNAPTAAGGAPHLLVDLSRLRFCDSTGLNILLRARLVARAAGGTMELAGPTQQVARMFHLTGADGVFRVHPDLDTGLSAGRTAGQDT